MDGRMDLGRWNGNVEVDTRCWRMDKIVCDCTGMVLPLVREEQSRFYTLLLLSYET